MQTDTLDKIHIRNLRVSTIIGVNPEEKEIEQDLLINLTLFTPIKDAAKNDSIHATINYDTVCRRIINLIKRLSPELIETLAEMIANDLLSLAGIQGCKVIVDKPGALESADSAAVEIFRTM